MSLATIILPLMLGVLLYGFAIYNRLTNQVNRFHHAFLHLGIQLKRRHGLIEELVRLPQSILNGDRQTLEALAAAKNEAVERLRMARQCPGDETAMMELTCAENTLDGALARVTQMVEFSPELCASAEIKRLLDELDAAGRRITLMSQIFNYTVMHYNTFRHGFPRVWLASAFGHRRDATPLGFVDSEMTPQAFQPAF